MYSLNIYEVAEQTTEQLLIWSDGSMFLSQNEASRAWIQM